MRELIKKSILIGLGAASLTKEKIDNVVAEFIRRKIITTKDGRWLVKQVLKELAKNKERLDKLTRLEGQLLGKEAKSIEKRLIKRGRRTAKKILSRAAKELR